MAARSKQSSRSRLLAALVVGALSLVACSGAKATSSSKPPPTVLVTPTPASLTPPPSLSPRDAAILAQYNAFWRALPVASAGNDDSARLQALIPTTTDPELSQLVRTLADQRKDGKGLYGINVPRAELASVAGGTASVRDCQASDQAGVQDLNSGAKLTVGVVRHLVTATLLDRSGTWKVSEVQYAPTGSQC